MLDAIGDVKTGLVTYATRDTVVNQMEIKKDAYIGLNDDTILVSSPNKLGTARALLEAFLDEDDEIVTVFYGEDVKEGELDTLKQYMEEQLEDIEIEFHSGDQPIYSFILMVE